MSKIEINVWKTLNLKTQPCIQGAKKLYIIWPSCIWAEPNLGAQVSTCIKQADTKQADWLHFTEAECYFKNLSLVFYGCFASHQELAVKTFRTQLSSIFVPSKAFPSHRACLLINDDPCDVIRDHCLLCILKEVSVDFEWAMKCLTVSLLH